MPSFTSDQSLELPSGIDNSNGPGALTAYNAGVESRLVKRYASVSDRTIRNPAPVEGELSYLIDTSLSEWYDGTRWVGTDRVTAFKSVQETITNDTLQNDNDLFWAIAANGYYLFELHVIYASGTTPDFKFAWTYPTGLNMAYGGLQLDTAGALVVVGGLNQTTVHQMGGTGGNAYATFTGVVANGATAGTLRLLWAQLVNDGTNTIMREGSWGVLTRVV